MMTLNAQNTTNLALDLKIWVVVGIVVVIAEEEAALKALIFLVFKMAEQNLILVI